MGPKITLKDISFLLFKGFFPVHLDWISKIRGNISIARDFIIKLCSPHNGDIAKFKWKIITVFAALASAALPPFLLPLPFSSSKPHYRLWLMYKRLARCSSFPKVSYFPRSLEEKSCSIFNYAQTSIKESTFSSLKEAGASLRVRTLITHFVVPAVSLDMGTDKFKIRCETL